MTLITHNTYAPALAPWYITKAKPWTLFLKEEKKKEEKKVEEKKEDPDKAAKEAAKEKEKLLKKVLREAGFHSFFSLGTSLWLICRLRLTSRRRSTDSDDKLRK